MKQMEENSRREHESVRRTGRTAQDRTSSAARGTARSQAARRKSRSSRRSILTPGRLVAAAVLIAAVVILVFVLRGCMGGKNTPAGVAERLIEECIAGKTQEAAECYGVTGAPEGALATEIEAAVSYYSAHNAQKMSVVKSDSLFETEDTAYVYVRYNLVLDDGQEYPCLRTFMTRKVEEKWTVVETSAVTETMQAQAEEAFNKFMTTGIYKDFNKDYDTFLKKNPGYEERISTKLA